MPLGGCLNLYIDRHGARGRWLVAVVLLAWVMTAIAYPPEVHGKLTFLAAQQLNRCVSDADIAPVTPLQVRFVARANEDQGDRNILRRMVQWRFYDRRQKERSVLGVIETRLHEHYNETVAALVEDEEDSDRYRRLGILSHYLQQVTVPAHVIPIFYGLPWRGYFTGDRFDDYPLDVEALEGRLDELCDGVTTLPDDLGALLTMTAERTRASVRGPIAGKAATWERFWEDDADPSDFGEYGVAGNNFGRAAQFPCNDGQICALTDDDPAYREFALERHLDAVRATMQGMLLVQRGLLPAQ